MIGNQGTRQMKAADATDRYIGKAYATSRPNWHDEDAAWKASQIIELLARNSLRPHRIGDIGCGAGGVLQSLIKDLDTDAVGQGFDISPYAISMAMEKTAPNLTYDLADFLTTDHTGYDLLLCIDVFEHIEDYFGFLKQLRTRARYFVFHIPLDMNVKGLLRNHHLTERREVGHLHYFDFQTALCTLRDAGYEVVDHFYTRKPTDSLLTKTIIVCENALAALSTRHFAVKIFGGVSLLVLARAPEQQSSSP
jgi:SAM-dependent methyltransferase